MTEVLGARVSVSASAHPLFERVSGTAVAETARTVSVDAGGPVPSVLPKDACTFLIDGLQVEGRLLGRPERRQ